MGRNVVRWTAGIGLVGAAAMIGMGGPPAAHADGTAGAVADSTVAPIVTTYPLELLGDASKNLTDASASLGPSPSDIPGLILQTDAQGHALNVLNGLIGAETSLDSYDNGAFADVLTTSFNAVDQGWDSATAALLSADTTAENAFSAGSSVDAALLGVFSADFMLLGDMANSFPIEFAAGLIAPSSLADLITSFGF